MDKTHDHFDARFRIIRYNDREHRWIRVQGKVFPAQGQKPEAFIGTVLDVTDTHRAQQVLERTVAERTRALTEANLRLQESNHDLEQFAYIASHDLQEPLRKIRIFSELIEERLPLSGEIRAYFAKVKDAAARMSRLIRDVLEYSRLTDTGQRRESVDLCEVVQEVSAELDWQIAEKGAVIETVGLPAVEGIRVQFCQLFRNMIGNALKFSRPKPHIRICADKVGPGDVSPFVQPAVSYIRLRFMDNGIGFEQGYATKMFKIFQRLNRHEDYEGSGIGLALCKKIVDNHGGAIEAEGKPGEGSVFTVYLPDR